MQMYFYIILIQSVSYNALFIQKLDCCVEVSLLLKS